MVIYFFLQSFRRIGSALEYESKDRSKIEVLAMNSDEMALYF